MGRSQYFIFGNFTGNAAALEEGKEGGRNIIRTQSIILSVANCENKEV